MKPGVGYLNNKSGFTIVELLIVVVIIAILAAITVVSFRGIQGRALDSQRLSGTKSITKALELYKINNGSYPTVALAGPTYYPGGWESSADESKGEFIKPLAASAYGLSSGTPVDPVNDTANNYTYLYYKYPAGANGCDATHGAFYVLGIKKTAGYGTAKHPDSPGFSCASRNWQSEFSWVIGGFEQ